MQTFCMKEKLFSVIIFTLLLAIVQNMTKKF